MAFLSGGFAAGAGAEGLEEVLKRAFLEQIERRRAQEAQQRIALDQDELSQRGRIADTETALRRDRLGLDKDEFGFRQSRATEDDRRYADEAPVRAANLRLHTAQAGDIERRPFAEEAARTFTASRDKTQHGYNLAEIGAQGQNALRVANVRHPDPSGAATTTKEQNEVEDSLNLIAQIRADKSLPTATGPIDARGLGMVRDLEGVTRVKALHDNLVNRMQLAQAGKLKGQGQISNMEREMLAKAATALQLKLGDPDYLNELAKVEAQFRRMLTGPRATPAPSAKGGFKVVEIK